MRLLASALSIVVLSSFWFAPPFHAQRETIPEAIARGSTQRSRSEPSGKPPSIDVLAARTDVVVLGILGAPRSYLSDDQINVWTEFPLTEATVLFDSEVATAKQPGQRRPLTVTQLGGTIMIDGKKFTQIEYGFPLMHRGTEGLFLLQRVNGRHEIVGLIYGAFWASGAGLKPMTPKQGFAEEYSTVPKAAAIGDIVSRVRKGRGK